MNGRQAKRIRRAMWNDLVSAKNLRRYWKAQAKGRTLINPKRTIKKKWIEQFRFGLISHVL